MAESMAHTPAEVIRALVVSLGLGTTPTNPVGSWPVYAENEPDTPDNCITIQTTIGQNQGSLMPTGEISGTFGVQIRVRSSSTSTGWVKSDAIQTGLAESIATSGPHAVTVGSRGYRVWQVTPDDVLPIGYESPTSRRQLFTINALATIVLTA